MCSERTLLRDAGPLELRRQHSSCRPETAYGPFVTRRFAGIAAKPIQSDGQARGTAVVGNHPARLIACYDCPRTMAAQSR